MITRVYSWWMGLRIGQKRFIKGCPYTTGKIVHFLPFALWTEEDKGQFFFHTVEQVWTGRKWEWKRNISISLLELERKTHEDGRGTACTDTSSDC